MKSAGLLQSVWNSFQELHFTFPRLVRDTWGEIPANNCRKAQQNSATEAGGFFKLFSSLRSFLFRQSNEPRASSISSAGGFCTTSGAASSATACASTSTQLMSETESQLCRLLAESLRFMIGTSRGVALHLLNQLEKRFQAAGGFGHCLE